MPVHRLNHAVVYVRDGTRSVAFCRDALGVQPIEAMDVIPGAAFLRAPGSTNDHDLGLFEVGAGAGASGGASAKARFGGQTRGGVSVSVSAPVR